MPRLGVVLPCRDEAVVLPRRLRNLAAANWPPGGGHRLVVVDDGSEDGTASVASALVAELFGSRPDVDAHVVANRHAPGKAGAVTTALEDLRAPSSDLVVLTDADVVVAPGALTALAAAFEARPGLGMACGSQRFVASLADDGSLAAADGGPPTPAGSRYDHVTAWVRALESRAGRLFSVHGQLLAWRADLGLAPTPGLAADDLDLMARVRAAGHAVAKVDDAVFLETKPPAGPARDAQALRRARAYVQIAAHLRLPASTPWLDRLQFLAYRTLPTASPWLALGVTLALPVAAGLAFRGVGAGLTAAALALAWASPPGRPLARLLLVIARARAAQRTASVDDRWEMARDG